MPNRSSIAVNELAWRPAAEVFPGYRLEGDTESDAGIDIKVLRGPQDGGGCWHVLLRFRPPPRRALRITAIARSDEEVFILDTDRAGHYSCNPAALRHGQTVTEPTTALVHYHGDPDEVLRVEIVDRAETNRA